MSVALLPSSRAEYPAILAEINAIKDEQERAARFVAWAELDFYFACKYVFSIGLYVIDEPDHPNFGGLWIDEKYMFDFCRTVQRDLEELNDDVLYTRARFHFKTEIITKCRTIWEWMTDPELTVCIMTHKVDQVGEKIYGSVRAEIEENETLRKYWSHRFGQDSRRDCPLWTNTALTIIRGPGPNDPSLSIHSILKLPVSGHYRRIIGDDCEVDSSVKSIEVIAAVEAGIRGSTALGSTDTFTSWVGTIHSLQGAYMHLLEQGFFSRRDRPWSCYGDDGSPILHGAEFLKKWRRKLGEYLFSCQMLGEPIPLGEQTFRPEWFHDNKYVGSPRDCLKGKVPYAFLDPGGSTAGSDFYALWVTALGPDKHFYELDLWREHLDISELLDLLFGPRDEDSRRWWIPQEGIIKRWNPKMLFVEEFSGLSLSSVIKREMKVRGYHFRCQPLPRVVTRSKEDRIGFLQPYYQRGEVHFPEDGFGHCSHKDGRDTMAQFYDSEYKLWTPEEGSVKHDDCLDSQAWKVQEEVMRLLRFPLAAVERSDGIPMGSQSRAKERISAWAM